MGTETTNAQAFNRVRDKLFELMKEKSDQGNEGAKQFLTPRYSMVICAKGHHLTGDGQAPTECPICKEKMS